MVHATTFVKVMLGLMRPFVRYVRRMLLLTCALSRWAARSLAKRLQ